MSVTPTMKTDRDKQADSLSSTVDSAWLKSSFILRDSDVANGAEYADFIKKNRYFSTADMKFTCTSPGMSMAVNPKPQFTRYCDPRRKGKISSRPDVTVNTRGHQFGLGMGSFYSEAHDDNQQRIFLRFGTPQYMPLLTWISRSFDVDKAILQNRGVITGTFLEAVNLVSKFFVIAGSPLISLGMFLSNSLVMSSRFYTVKDNMYTYWATVENIMNSLVARRTMVPMVFQDFSHKLDNTMNREQKVTSTFVKGLSELIPDIIDEETGRISVFAIALRSQAAFNKMLKDDMDRNGNKKLSEDFTGYQLTGQTSHDTYFTNNKGKPSIFADWFFKNAYDLLIKDNPDEKGDTEGTNGSVQPNLISYNPLYTGPDGAPLNITPDLNDPNSSPDQVIADNIQSKKGTYEKFKEYALAELSEGMAFAVFNVESTGSVSESFSNTTTSNPIEATFNSISSKARNLTNLLSSATDIPIIGDALKLAADAGAIVTSNATFGLANPLLALAYGVNITMPKVWENSSASLPRASYKIKLISPYGNSYSQLFNIYLPLSMIMAGSLPRSTGSTSYMSPFVCQLFDRGRTNIQLGIVDNVTFTRGTSNLPFSRNGHPNAIDVDLSIANLDEIIAVDVNSNGVISKLTDALSPNIVDTPMSSYLNTITGVDVYTQTYRIPMIRLKLAEKAMQVKSVINGDPAALGAFVVNSIPGEGLAKLILGNNQAALQDITQR